MAEREGFEPSVLLLVRLISSQVHSTTLPPLRTEKKLYPCNYKTLASGGLNNTLDRWLY